MHIFILKKFDKCTSQIEQGISVVENSKMLNKLYLFAKQFMQHGVENKNECGEEFDLEPSEFFQKHSQFINKEIYNNLDLDVLETVYFFFKKFLPISKSKKNIQKIFY